MISPRSDIDRLELECLIGEARTAAILLEIVVNAALREQDHIDGRLEVPMSEPHESALTFCAAEVMAIVENLYNRFHGIEIGDAS
jgi:hypothetical protein